MLSIFQGRKPPVQPLFALGTLKLSEKVQNTITTSSTMRAAPRIGPVTAYSATLHTNAYSACPMASPIVP